MKAEKIKETKEEKSAEVSRLIIEKIKQARGTSKPRKFSQTWDLIINLKGMDLKKPENRFNDIKKLIVEKDIRVKKSRSSSRHKKMPR